MEEPTAIKITRDTREPVADPHYMLWQSLMDIATVRVNIVLRFARNWRDLRYDARYERERSKAHFHLSWIMDDSEASRFTFRTLCQFSAAEDLSDVESAREKILSMFDRDALAAVLKPVEASMWDSIARQFCREADATWKRP